MDNQVIAEAAHRWQQGDAETTQRGIELDPYVTRHQPACWMDLAFDALLIAEFPAHRLHKALVLYFKPGHPPPNYFARSANAATTSENAAVGWRRLG